MPRKDDDLTIDCAKPGFCDHLSQQLLVSLRLAMRPTESKSSGANFPDSGVQRRLTNLISGQGLCHDVGFMLTEEISFEDFKKMDIRVGVVTGAERVRRSEKLYKILVDMGDLGTRQTISSLVGYYEPGELVGKRIVFLTNLKTAKFAGEVSQGMLLAAEIEGKLALLTTDREIQQGARIT